MITRARYVLLNAYHILIDGLFDAVPILLAFIALSFGSGEKEIGLIVSLGAMLGTAAGLGTLFLSRNLGFLRTLTLTTAMYGAGFFAAAFAGNMAVVGLCFTLAVAGHSIFHNISFSYLTIHTERHCLGRILSDFTAIGDIGRIPLVSLAAFAAAGVYADIPGWRAVCLTYGVLTLGAALWLLLFAPDEEQTKTDESVPRSHFPAFVMLRNRETGLSMLANVLNAFSNDRIFTFLPLLLMAKGIDPAIIGSFALGFTVGSFLGKMACGRLVDHFGSRRVFVIAQLTLTALLCVLIPADNIALIVIIALLLGVVTKGTVPVIQAIITEPVENPAAYDDIFSISSFVRGITNMLTPLFFGFLASAWSMNAIYGIMAVTATLAVLPVLLMRKAQRSA